MPPGHLGDLRRVSSLCVVCTHCFHLPLPCLPLHPLASFLFSSQPPSPSPLYLPILLRRCACHTPIFFSSSQKLRFCFCYLPRSSGRDVFPLCRRACARRLCISSHHQRRCWKLNRRSYFLARGHCESLDPLPMIALYSTPTSFSSLPTLETRSSTPSTKRTTRSPSLLLLPHAHRWTAVSTLDCT